MFDFNADQDNLILTGALEAFTQTAGVPNGSQFLYGTVKLGNTTFGIITSFTLASSGEKSPIKGAAGLKLATAIIDPGLTAKASILYPLSLGRPKQGQILTFNLPSETALAADENVKFILMDFSIKWEREGWRMIDVELENNKAMMTSGIYSYNIDSDGTLGALIDSND